MAGGISRGFKKKEIVETVEEEVKVSEIDKLKSYIKNKKLGNVKEDFLLDTIKDNYIENISNYEKTKKYIDFISELGETVILNFNTLLYKKHLYFLFMSVENTAIVSSLIKLTLYNTDIDNNYISYLINSRSYFSDNEMWYARVYEVINNKLDIDSSLEEDKMRIGIYPNFTHKTIDELDKKLDMIKLKTNSISKDIDDNEKYMNEVNEDIRNKNEHIVDNIDSTFKKSIKDIQIFTNESLNSIKRILNLNPDKKEEILKELEKEYNFIDAFNEKIDIKERYERLISMKDKNTIYHPKFNEVLKYFLAGNTVCLNGPSKCGKTTLAKQLSKLFGLEFYNIGNVYDEDLQINGYYDFNTNYNKPTFQKVFENGGILLMKNIESSPKGVVTSLNNIISNFSYNPYVFGDKLLTTPSKNFRLLMTNNNNGLDMDRTSIDNVVNISMDYDINYENSLSKDIKLIEFLHELRKCGINITTSTIIDITKHLNLGLFSIEELLQNYIVTNNSIDLLNRTTEKIGQSNYGQTLQKILKR